MGEALDGAVVTNQLNALLTSQTAHGYETASCTIQRTADQLVPTLEHCKLPNGSINYEMNLARRYTTCKDSEFRVIELTDI